MASKFRLLLEISRDTDLEWSLFQTAMILSAVESCQKNSGIEWRREVRRTPWWNQDVQAIRAKQDSF